MEQNRTTEPLVLEAVLQAADVARIGIAVSLLTQSSSRCVYATETAARMLGTPVTGLVGHSLRDFIVPEDLPTLLGAAQRMLDAPVPSGSVVEVRAQRPDGTRLSLLLAYSPTTVGDEPAVVTFLVNIGEQREAERRTHETAHRLAQLVKQSPDIIVISRREVILEANPAAARILGVMSPAELVGRSLREFILGEDARVMRERMGRLARGEDVGAPHVYRATRVDGSTALVEIISFTTEYGGAPANVAFGRDVTERERLREQMGRTERLAALGTLAAGVAHEINNPLAALALNVELLTRAVPRAALDTHDREAGATALAEIVRATERMTAIVRDLSGFSRDRPDQLGAVDVATVIDRALRITRHATRGRATVEVELRPGPPVHGNAGRLEQVLVNLVVNAVQALPEERGEAGNRITVRTSSPEPGQVAIEVSDNGVGIPPEVVGRVFDPFFTTKPAGVGTGLGLFVSHNVVQQMDGQIAVESRPGTGTTMRVLLRAAGPTVPEPHVLQPTLSATGCRVLVVDDEPTLCRTLELLLQPRHQVVTAGGAEAALAAAAAQPFDVVLCDLMMRDTSGMELLPRLAAARPGLERRVIFMTGGAVTEQARRFLATTPNLWLQKPFTIDALEGALQHLLAQLAR